MQLLLWYFLTFEIQTITVQLMLGQARRCIYVASMLKKMVRLHLYQIRGHIPNIFTIVNNANHGITIRKESSAKFTEIQITF